MRMTIEEKKQATRNWFQTQKEQIAASMPVITAEYGQIIEIKGVGQYQLLHRRVSGNNQPVLVAITCD